MSIAARISSVTLRTRNGTEGAVIPKSPNFQLGFAVAVRTASDGRLTPTSCSRTRIVAFDLSVTVHAAPDPAAAVAVAAGVAVGVGLASETVADPPHAAASIPAARTPGM